MGLLSHVNRECWFYLRQAHWLSQKRGQVHSLRSLRTTGGITRLNYLPEHRDTYTTGYREAADVLVTYAAKHRWNLDTFIYRSFSSTAIISNSVQNTHPTEGLVKKLDEIASL